MRKRKKEAMLRNQNANKLDESAAPIEVQEAVVTQTQVVSEAVQQGKEEEVAAINSDSSLSADEKHRRIQQVEEDYSSELHKIREQAERAKKVLEDGFANTKLQEKKSLADRMAARKANRERELIQNGVDASEAAQQAAREADERRVVEELQ